MEEIIKTLEPAYRGQKKKIRFFEGVKPIDQKRLAINTRDLEKLLDAAGISYQKEVEGTRELTGVSYTFSRDRDVCCTVLSRGHTTGTFESIGFKADRKDVTGKLMPTDVINMFIEERDYGAIAEKFTHSPIYKQQLKKEKKYKSDRKKAAERKKNNN